MLEVDESSSNDGNTKEDIMYSVLRTIFGNTNVTLEVRDIEYVVTKGNNFFGDLRRIFLNISRSGLPVQDKTLVVKELTKSAFLRQYAKDASYSQTETAMYKDILPKMNRIATNVLGNSSFSAKSFDTGMEDILVMEDLGQLGYKMADRLVGLNLEHCKMAVRSIARFHGISVAMTESYGPVLDVLPETLFQEGKEVVLDSVFSSRYEAVSKVVETWPGYERFGERLRNVGSTATRRVIGLNNRRNTELAVLNHGDFWLNNILFRCSDTGEVEDVKFVDYQASRRASPAVDLHYFLVSTPDDEVRRDGVQTLLEVYHGELCRVMKALDCGYKLVSFDWLRNELKDKMSCALHDSCCILNILVADPDVAASLADETDHTGYGEKMNASYNGTRYRQILEKLLLMFEKEGVL